MVKVLIPTDDGGNMTSLDEVKNAIFLAGPCPREDYENADKWRKDAIDILNDIGFDGYVLNPTNKNYLKMRNLEKQTMRILFLRVKKIKKKKNLKFKLN